MENMISKTVTKIWICTDLVLTCLPIFMWIYWDYIDHRFDLDLFFGFYLSIVVLNKLVLVYFIAVKSRIRHSLRLKYTLTVIGITVTFVGLLYLLSILFAFSFEGFSF